MGVGIESAKGSRALRGGTKNMKNSLAALLLLALVIASGCASQKNKAATKPAAAVKQAIVTPDVSLTAKVVSVNVVGRFVVLDFPNGQMPKLQQTLSLYRAGLKVGEVKITGPQAEDNIVADLTAGEAKVGDTVRN